jgi:hypothetical protein
MHTQAALRQAQPGFAQVASTWFLHTFGPLNAITFVIASFIAALQTVHASQQTQLKQDLRCLHTEQA